MAQMTIDQSRTIVIPTSPDGRIRGRIVMSNHPRHVVAWQTGERTVVEVDSRGLLLGESEPLTSDDWEDLESEDLADVEVEMYADTDDDR